MKIVGSWQSLQGDNPGEEWDVWPSFNPKLSVPIPFFFFPVILRKWRWGVWDWNTQHYVLGCYMAFAVTCLQGQAGSAKSSMSHDWDLHREGVLQHEQACGGEAEMVVSAQYVPKGLLWVAVGSHMHLEGFECVHVGCASSASPCTHGKDLKTTQFQPPARGWDTSP